MNPKPLDQERVERISTAIFAAIRDNYQQGPISRDRCLEALNALAGAAAVVIAGANDPEALAFFRRALAQNIQHIARQHASSNR